MIIGSLFASLPEIFVAILTMVMLLVGVFSKEETAQRNTLIVALAGSVVTYILLHLVYFPGAYIESFVDKLGTHYDIGMSVSDGFAFFTKALILFAATFAMLISCDYLKRNKIYKFEFYVLCMLSVLGMMIMASAKDLIMAYIGLELMSFSLYILAAFNRDSKRSTESGLKYFVLGSVASCVMLYGISLVYGMVSDTSFAVIYSTLSSISFAEGYPITLIVALVFILVAFAFKISAVPFHMWTPDVYEGAPTPTTAFMSSAPKIAAFALLIRVLYDPLLPLLPQWEKIFVILAILTMGIGSILAIVQDNFKRLLAYSSIANVGFMLVGLVAGTAEGIASVLIYLGIYIVTVLGCFAVLMAMRSKEDYYEDINDFKGLSKREPILAFVMLLLMFSMAGVPPLAGFFAKFYVFAAAVDAGFTHLAVIGVIFSVISAYYCLRIVKIMYFEEGAKIIDKPVCGLKVYSIILALGVVIMGLIPSYLADSALIAAKSIF